MPEVCFFSSPPPRRGINFSPETDMGPAFEMQKKANEKGKGALLVSEYYPGTFHLSIPNVCARVCRFAIARAV